jgi:hypothetical protein
VSSPAPATARTKFSIEDYRRCRSYWMALLTLDPSAGLGNVIYIVHENLTEAEGAAAQMRPAIGEARGIGIAGAFRHDGTAIKGSVTFTGAALLSIQLVPLADFIEPSSDVKSVALLEPGDAK